MSRGLETLRHLRRVHFALVSTSFALLAASSIALDYDLEEAIDQLDQVQRLDRWVSPDLWEPIAWEWFPGAAESAAWLSQQSGLCFEYAGERSYHPLGERNVLKHQVDALVREDDPASPGYSQTPEQAKRSHDWLVRLFRAERWTLADFQEKWSELREDRSVRGWSIPPSRMVEVTFVPGASPVEARLAESSDDCSRNSGNDARIKSTSFDFARGQGATLEVSLHDGGLAVLPLESVTRELNPLRLLSTDDGVPRLPALETGRAFEVEFPSLARVAAGVESLTLEDLAGYLRGLREREGGQFSLFGAGVPFRLLGRWGMAVLVAVQVFFFVHLRAGRWPASTRFAWIGVYRDRLARALFHGSISVLPVAAALALFLRGVKAAGPAGMPGLWQVAGFLTSILLAALTFRASVGRTRRSREVVPPS